MLQLACQPGSQPPAAFCDNTAHWPAVHHVVRCDKWEKNKHNSIETYLPEFKRIKYHRMAALCNSFVMIAKSLAQPKTPCPALVTWFCMDVLCFHSVESRKLHARLKHFVFRVLTHGDFCFGCCRRHRISFRIHNGNSNFIAVAVCRHVAFAEPKTTQTDQIE